MSWRRVGIAAGSFALAGILVAALAMAINLVRFERAAICESGISRNCIQVSMGTITSPGRQVDNSWCGTGPGGACVDRVDYSIVVTPEGATREVELWDTREHPDFALGDAVRLERWHGQYIAVTDGGHRIEVNDWNPRLLAVLLLLAPISALVIAPLWRFKVIARVRGLGVLVLVYGGVYLLLLCYIAVPASSPLLYLR